MFNWVLTVDFVLQEGITTIGTEDSDEPQDICKLAHLSACVMQETPLPPPPTHSFIIPVCLCVCVEGGGGGGVVNFLKCLHTSPTSSPMCVCWGRGEGGGGVVK